MTTAGTPLEGPKSTPDEKTHVAFVDAVQRIESVCMEMIDREGANRFIMVTLMRAVGITDFLAATASDYPREMTDELGNRIHKAFGSPRDWGEEGHLGIALKDLYLA